MFIRNAWYAAGWSAEIEPGKLLSRTLLGDRVVFYRKGDGALAALQDRCPHRFVPLHVGKVKGDSIQCGYHGLEFAADGVCVHNPHGDGKISSAMRVKTYAVAERDGVIWFWGGEAADADLSTITRFPFVTDPRYKSVFGMMNVEANYQLINDNLLDLSHTQYVHPLFQRERDEVVEGVLSPTLENGQDGDVLFVKLFQRNIPMTPFVALFESGRDRVDNWVDTYWRAPSIIHLDIGTRAPGSARGEGGDVETPSIHLLTPETETSTHYFWAMVRNVKLDDEGLSQALWDSTNQAFAFEDKPLIEMQQREIGQVDLLAKNPVLLQTDSTAVRARRILTAMMEAEQTGVAAAAE